MKLLEKSIYIEQCLNKILINETMLSNKFFFFPLFLKFEANANITSKALRSL